MRIAFFGGSFDPPHRGHLVLASAAAERFSLDRVLLAPAGLQPLKPDGPAASFSDRLEMVRLLCTASKDPRLMASNIDAPRADGQPNFTVDALSALRSSLNETDQLSSIVGIDAFLGLRDWRSPDRLLELSEWIVVTRPGFPPSRLAELTLTPTQMEHIHLLPGIAEDVSATQLRQTLLTGTPAQTQLPEPVLDYIRTHHLYGT